MLTGGLSNAGEVTLKCFEMPATKVAIDNEYVKRDACVNRHVAQ